MTLRKFLVAVNFTMAGFNLGGFIGNVIAGKPLFALCYLLAVAGSVFGGCIGLSAGSVKTNRRGYCDD